MGNALRARLAHRLPFYYGWVIFGIASLASYSSRPLMAVATLTVFVVPMTEEFGWSRGLFSGAVSLGGICAVAISPFVGRLIDRYGSGLMIAASAAVAGACAVGLSLVGNIGAFYGLYVPGRMAFASPLELGTSTAVSNWFIRRRPFALAMMGVTQGTGLALMPLVAQFIIEGWDWRTAWVSLGFYTLAVGVAPTILFMARRPEDMGLEPDPVKERKGKSEAKDGQESPQGRRLTAAEINYTLRQALRTRAFWVLALFSAAGFMVQGAVSLHQVPHYINQGLSGPAAALTASTFAFSQVPGGLMWSTLARRVPVRHLLALSGACVVVGAAGTALSSTLLWGLMAAAVLGAGVGGLHLLLRLAWADYYGRQNLGAIRGATLPIQILGQAGGNIFGGFAFDVTGAYIFPFITVAAAAALASFLVSTARPPVFHQEEAAAAEESGR